MTWMKAAATLMFGAVLLGNTLGAAERLSDEQVKRLMEDIDHGYDRWKDALERKNLDDAVLRSAAGTVDVRKFLEDFEDEIDTFKDRFTSNYSAGSEALALLRRGSDVERRYRTSGQTGASEWSALGANFATLAQAYGTPWPIETMDVQAGRLNDDELVTRLGDLERSTERLKDEADRAAKKDTSIERASREEMTNKFDRLEQSVKEVRSRVDGDRPSSAEVRDMLGLAADLGRSTAALPLSPQGRAAWTSIEGGCLAISRAFGESWAVPPAR